MFKYKASLFKIKKQNFIIKIHPTKTTKIIDNSTELYYDYSYDIYWSLKNKINGFLSDSFEEKTMKLMKDFFDCMYDSKKKYEGFQKIFSIIIDNLLEIEKYDEEFRNLSNSINNFGKTETKSISSEIKRAKWSFKCDYINADKNLKDWLKNIDFLIDEEKFKNNQENLNTLEIIRIQCELSLLKYELNNPNDIQDADNQVKDCRVADLIKELDKLVEKLEKYDEKSEEKLKKDIIEIIKCELIIAAFYNDLSRFDKELIHWSKIVNTDPSCLNEVTTYSKVYYNLAKCHSNLGKKEMAFSFYEKCAKEIETKMENSLTVKEDLLFEQKNIFAITQRKQMNFYKFHAHIYENMYDLGIPEKDFEELALKALEVLKKSGRKELYSSYLIYFLFEINYRKRDCRKIVSYGDKFLNVYLEKNVTSDDIVFQSESDVLWHHSSIYKVKQVLRNDPSKFFKDSLAGFLSILHKEKKRKSFI